MADFLNLQINGVQVAMYGMVGLTTAVLAYATAGGAMESFAAKTMGALSPSALMGSESVAALGNLTPFASPEKGAEPEPEKEPEPEQEKEPEPEEEKAPEEAPSSLEVETGQDEPATTGGKKRRNKKTPKHRKSKKQNKSRKSKKAIKTK